MKGFVSSTGHLLLTSEAEVHISRSGVTGVRCRILYLFPTPSARKVKLTLGKEPVGQSSVGQLETSSVCL